MFKSIKAEIVKSLKYVVAIFAVITPLFVIYGFVVQWPPIQSELEKYPGSVAIFTGFESISDDEYKWESRTYLLVNYKHMKSHTLTIAVDSNGGREKFLETGGALKAFSYYGLLVLGMYWFWVRKSHNGKGDKRCVEKLMPRSEKPLTNDEWICSKCNEYNPDSFDFCWHCKGPYDK